MGSGARLGFGIQHFADFGSSASGVNGLFKKVAAHAPARPIRLVAIPGHVEDLELRSRSCRCGPS